MVLIKRASRKNDAFTCRLCTMFPVYFMRLAAVFLRNNRGIYEWIFTNVGMLFMFSKMLFASILFQAVNMCKENKS
jgi:hypothetical protein